MTLDENRTRSETDHRSHLSYTLDQFEGPLDLLLYLIQKAQINIYDIPIAQITDQFIGYLNLAEKPDLDELADFYLMAAHLLLIKSRMLLPRSSILDDDEELDDPRSELVERLLEYQKYKRYSTLLSDSNRQGELYIQRKKAQFMLPFDDSDLWNEISVWDLLKTFTSLLRSITTEQVFNVYEEVTTKQKITLMYELFEKQDELSFFDIVANPESRLDVICAFLAILEAVKFHMVVIIQHQLFGDILIRKREDFQIEDYDEMLERQQVEDELQVRQDQIVQKRMTAISDDPIGDDDEVIEFDDEEADE
ncbi:MAG: segregation/condensation protein A [Sphaerochaetaceae bacterium]|jgi:segregation and condensation protein A|nr:segregation/condensation protein A [Sphaerochaetaceae bacterium]